jgi:hypothetical protein
MIYFGSFPGVNVSVDKPLDGVCSTSEQLVRFEATPTYMAHPKAAANIVQMLPEVRNVHGQTRGRRPCTLLHICPNYLLHMLLAPAAGAVAGAAA